MKSKIKKDMMTKGKITEIKFLDGYMTQDEANNFLIDLFAPKKNEQKKENISAISNVPPVIITLTKKDHKK